MRLAPFRPNLARKIKRAETVFLPGLSPRGEGSLPDFAGKSGNLPPPLSLEHFYAVYQVLKERDKDTAWERFEPAVCSLIIGASTVSNDLSNHINDIRTNFGQVVVVFDQDEASKKAKIQAIKLLPNAQAVLLPTEDANDCIVEGYERGLW